MKRISGVLAAAIVIGAMAAAAAADGMIVPVRPDLRVRGDWAVTYHHVKMTVRDQVATVSVDQEFVNTGGGMIEVEYMFPVPPEAAIDSMTLLVNGKEFQAQLLPADEARRIYEDIVRKKKDPALLEYAGFGLIKTRAFPLEPNKPAHVVVNYKYTCRKDGDTVEVWYPLNTEKYSAKPIKDVEVIVDIKSKGDVLAPYSPTHEITCTPKDTHQTVVTYHQKDTLPTSDFQVFYKESSKDVGATMLAYQPTGGEDGYFQILVSPNPRLDSTKVQPKDVVLMLDYSSSMRVDNKLDQAKDALRLVLKNLGKKDRFNVVVYCDLVESFFDKLADANEANVAEALERLDRIEATGGTNMHEALLMAMKMCAGDAQRPAYVILLADGIPTVGKTDEKQILAETKAANGGRTRLFAFGVGYDVNVRLLDKLAEDSNGRSDYVKPKEPIEGKVSSLYAKIRNPVMTNVAIRIDGVKLRDMYPRQIGDLFEGDQVVVVGRYDARKLPGPAEQDRQAQLVVTGTYDGKERGFEYPVTIHKPGRRGYEFVQKLWAIRRVGYLLDQIQLHGENKELIDELVRLSKTYGIMTPYTAFLADERTPLAATSAHAEAAREYLGKMSGGADASGAAGQMDAMNRQELRQAANVPAPTAPGPAAAPAKSFGYSDTTDYDIGRKRDVANLRQIGNQAVYQRGRVWVAANASHLDPQKDASQIKTIDRFSEEYFRLVRSNTVEENQVLASQQEGEELLITLRNQAYQIR